MRQPIMLAMLAGLACFAAPAARADHLDQTTQEVRTVLYYHVPDAALARVLPEGWRPAAIGAGPGKGANLTVNLSEQLSAVRADGSAAGDARGRAVTISARVRDDASADNRAMVLFGITTGADVPGPYGRHHAGLVSLTRSAQAASGPTVQMEYWDASTPEGDRLALALRWTRGDIVPAHADQQTRSSLHPAFYRVYRIDSLSDVVRSQATGVDRAEDAQVQSAGQVASLLDAADALVAIVAIPVFHREIWLPE